MKTLNKDLRSDALEIIESGNRAFVFAKAGKLAIYDGNSVAAYQAKQQGWKFVGETFNGENYF